MPQFGLASPLWRLASRAASEGLVNFDNAQERLASEARAYAAELRCLTAKLSEQFCIGGTCNKVVRARINDIVKDLLPSVFDGTYPNGNYGAE